jgi:hypothetical protein
VGAQRLVVACASSCRALLISSESFLSFGRICLLQRENSTHVGQILCHAKDKFEKDKFYALLGAQRLVIASSMLPWISAVHASTSARQIGPVDAHVYWVSTRVGGCSVSSVRPTSQRLQILEFLR